MKKYLVRISKVFSAVLIIAIVIYSAGIVCNKPVVDVDVTVKIFMKKKIIH